MRIDLKLISQRLLFRYYPVFLLISGSFIMFMHLTRSNFEFSIAVSFFIGQLTVLFIYLFIIIPLALFKPDKPTLRIFTIILSMLSAILIIEFVTIGERISPAFQLALVALQNEYFLLNLSTGIIICWFFILAEKHYTAEIKLKIESGERLRGEKQLEEDRLKLLQARIEPEFILKSLNEIVTLSDTQPEQAKSIRMRFIQYLRSSLKKARGTTSTLEEELALLKAYLEFISMKQNSQISFEEKIDTAINRKSYCPDIIQSLVSSVLDELEESRKIGLDLKVFGEPVGRGIQLTLVFNFDFTDTIEFNNRIKQSHKYQLLKQHVESLYGKGSLTLPEQKPDKGYSITIFFSNDG